MGKDAKENLLLEKPVASPLISPAIGTCLPRILMAIVAQSSLSLVSHAKPQRPQFVRNISSRSDP